MKPVILESIRFSSIDVTTRTTWVFAEIFDAEGISEVVEITSGNNSNAVAKTLREMVNNIKGLSISGESELRKLQQHARDVGLISSLIIDAGLTEVPPNTVTCLGIGPASESAIDTVTGNCSLF